MKYVIRFSKPQEGAIIQVGATIQGNTVYSVIPDTSLPLQSFKSLTRSRMCGHLHYC